MDEIARLSLAFLRQMRIMREESSRFPEIYARMGIHSGNTVAGVIGSKMPRFCLFGETINLASRMETNGEPRRIQISSTTKTLLDLTEASSYVTKARGPIHIKVFSVFYKIHLNSINHFRARDLLRLFGCLEEDTTKLCRNKPKIPWKNMRPMLRWRIVWIYCMKAIKILARLQSTPLKKRNKTENKLKTEKRFMIVCKT